MIHGSTSFVAQFRCASCRSLLKARIQRSSAGKKVQTKCPSCDALLRLRIPEHVANVQREVPPPAKTIKKTRNDLRNAPMGNARACKHCKFSWPASTHLGRFESYQSRCLNGKKACVEVHPRKMPVA